VTELKAGDVFHAGAGTFKSLITVKECRFMNIIATDETTVEGVSEMAIDESYMEHFGDSLELIPPSLLLEGQEVGS